MAKAFYLVRHSQRLEELIGDSYRGIRSSGAMGLDEPLRRTGLEDIVEEVFTRLDDLEEFMALVVLTIDPLQYLRFKQIAPHVYQTLNDPALKVHRREDGEPSADDYYDCLGFVFETVLRWQTIQLKRPDWT